MILRPIVAAAILVAAAAPLRAAVISHTAPNGLSVTVREEPGASLVEVELRYHAGSGLDAPGREGTAHLLEHLLMESTVDRPRGGLAQAIFLHSVHANAHTDVQRLTFETTCLPAQLDSVLAIELARASGWAPDPVELERERLVVLEEIAYRRRGSAISDLANELLSNELSGHPYGRPIGGLEESVRAITVEDIQEYSRRWLQLDAASLAIVGPVNASEVVERIDATLGQVATNREWVEFPPIPAPRGSGAILDRSDITGLAAVRLFRAPMEDAEDLALNSLLSVVLQRAGYAGGWRHVGEDAWHDAPFTFTYFVAPEIGFHEVDSEGDAQRVLSATWREITLELRRLGLPGRFDEVRQQWIAEIESRENEMGGTAEDLAEEAFDAQSERSWTEALKLAKEMEVDVARAWLAEATSDKRVSVGVAHGRDSGRNPGLNVTGLGNSEEPPRVQDPLAAMDPAVVRAALSEYRAAELAPLTTTQIGGASWTHLQLKDARKVTVGGRLRVQRLKNEARNRKPGIAQVYGRLVNYGYRRKGRDRDVQWSERRLPHDARLRATPTALNFEARDEPEEASAMFAALAERFEKDSFDLQVWERLLESGAAGDRKRASWIDTRAQKFLAASVFGEDHPVLSRWRVPGKTYDKLEFDDITDAHEAFTRNGSLGLWTVGPGAAKDLQPMLEATLARFGQSRNLSFEPAAIVPVSETMGTVISAFDRQEVTLRVLVGVYPDGVVDGAAMAVLESLVNQRLHGRLRTETGVAYRIGVSRWEAEGRHLLQVETGSSPHHARVAFAELLDVLRCLSTDPPAAPEIDRARLHAIKKQCAWLADPERAIDALGQMRSLGVPLEQPQRAILDVTDPTLLSLAQQTLDAWPRAFAVIGPILEDELEVYERQAEATAGK